MSFSTDRYLSRNYGPRYRCWQMLRESFLDLTGSDIGEPHEVWSDHSRFARLAEARSPCIVLLRRRRFDPHVGLFYRGRMLHIGPAGARYERLNIAAFGYTDVRFYACRA